MHSEIEVVKSSGFKFSWVCRRWIHSSNKHLNRRVSGNNGPQSHRDESGKHIEVLGEFQRDESTAANFVRYLPVS
jgi:hypothetical protein